MHVLLQSPSGSGHWLGEKSLRVIRSSASVSRLLETQRPSCRLAQKASLSIKSFGTVIVKNTSSIRVREISCSAASTDSMPRSWRMGRRAQAKRTPWVPAARSVYHSTKSALSQGSSSSYSMSWNSAELSPSTPSSKFAYLFWNYTMKSCTTSWTQPA